MTAVFAPHTPAPTQTDDRTAINKFARELLAAPKIDGPLAVLDFQVTGGVSRIGRLIANQLSDCLGRTARVRVLEPANVRETLNQEVLNPEGFPEPVELKRLAAALGVQHVIPGTVTCTGKKALVQAFVVVPASDMIVARAQMIVRCP